MDAIFGIPPTVAIEQRVSRGGRKSTVGTTTEIHHFLRLLYVKLGVPHCPHCVVDGRPVAVTPQSTDSIVAQLMREHKGEHIGVLALVDFDKPNFALLEHFDWWGLISMAGFLGSLEYVLEEGPRNDWLQDESMASGPSA
mgnify:CR=1 FL=1